MSRMPSFVWIIVMVLGGIAAVVGNVGYPLSRQREEKQSTAKTVRETLKTELQGNLEQIVRMRSNLNKNPKEVTTSGLKAGAWSAIANGQLLLGLNANLRSKLIKAYGLVNDANDYHKQLLESYTGVTLALSGIENIRNVWFAALSNTINELEPLLHSILKEI